MHSSSSCFTCTAVMLHLGLEGECYSRFWKLKLRFFFFFSVTFHVHLELSCSESCFKVILGGGSVQGTDNGEFYIQKTFGKKGSRARVDISKLGLNKNYNKTIIMD